MLGSCHISDLPSHLEDIVGIYFKARMTAAALVATTVMAMGASAATIDFTGVAEDTYTNYQEDGYILDYVRVVDGNCTSVSGQPCGAENKNETSTLTQSGGGLFSVSSIWFKFLGSFTQIGFITDKGSVDYVEGVDFVHNNNGNVLDLSAIAMFQDISYLTIVDVAMTSSQSGNANIRFDDIVVSDVPDSPPAPVPLPATGLLLLGGLGLLGAARRHRKA